MKDKRVGDHAVIANVDAIADNRIGDPAICTDR